VAPASGLVRGRVAVAARRARDAASGLVEKEEGASQSAAAC